MVEASDPTLATERYGAILGFPLPSSLCASG